MAVQMVTEQQKYLSEILRNVGIACSAPSCSILFQWFVFKEGAYFGHFLFSVLLLILGILSLVVGYIMLRRKTNK